MTTNETDGMPDLPVPDPDLRVMNRMVGTWTVSGGAEGTITFEWMEGGFFLMQRVDLQQNGLSIKGIEIIGHLRSFGEQPTEEIRSRYYDTMGNTFDYVYELTGDDITIWAGEKDSGTYYLGTFTDDDTMIGEWFYPDGGGYRVTGMRLAL
ncbi:MAG: hypothetical protein JWN03_1689 [Nocardia sp.]|uniref:hypothetical protein n=1 Tax=Nocardia sp. TaxID=1821 RepID=UPI002629BFB6|nr:hypothetical protein [Nocardia sp.]MCU1641414.1 hypothetical protein [Nocardia sp.]